MFTGLESPVHLLLLLVIILLLFGAKRLPEMGRSLGRGIQEFKEGLSTKEEPQEATENKSVTKGMGQSLGQSIQEFKEGLNDTEEPHEAVKEKRDQSVEAEKKEPKAEAPTKANSDL
jgi:sec-independent protein translocase protein TatA